MISSQLFESFQDVPAAWGGLCAHDDLAMDLDLLRIFQETLAGQCRCWGVTVFDSGRPIGCAALCRFDTELIETHHPLVVRWRETVRRAWPGFAKMGVLFCGLPIPSGSTHLRVREGAEIRQVLSEIERVMLGLARATRSRLLVFKELDARAGVMTASLAERGYVRGSIPPMHLLERSFAHFAEYRDNLKSRYRAQVQRSQKKLAAAGFEILSGRGSRFFAEHFDDAAYLLYVAVQMRAKQKLELLPAEFFHQTARVLDNDILLTVIRRDGRVSAFTFSVTRGKVHYNMYSGLDYDVTNEGDLYFNLFYQDMDCAFRDGASCMHLGQTSDAFKSRLGTTTDALYFFARSPSPLFTRLLKLFAPLAFPKVEPVERHDVFASDGTIKKKR